MARPRKPIPSRERPDAHPLWKQWHQAMDWLLAHPRDSMRGRTHTPWRCFLKEAPCTCYACIMYGQPPARLAEFKRKQEENLNWIQSQKTA